MIQGVRQFKMVNGTGAEYDMTRPEALFWEPDGLGWGTEPETVQAGDSLITVNEVQTIPAPSGNMVFREYEEYHRFLTFLQVGDLVFCYRPIDTWYYLPVSIQIDKSEIDYTNKHLVCPVSFTAKGFWYEAVTLFRASSTSGGKIYPYSYPYTYGESIEGNIRITNGALPSYMRITFFGPVENPTWFLYHNSKEVGRGQINISVPNGNKLVIDSSPETMEIAEYTDNGTFVADRYGNSDFETDRLLKLPAGVSTLTFSQTGVTTVNAIVEVKKRV